MNNTKNIRPLDTTYHRCWYDISVIHQKHDCMDTNTKKMVFLEHYRFLQFQTTQRVTTNPISCVYIIENGEVICWEGVKQKTQYMY
jgi:hypothetical protein